MPQVSRRAFWVLVLVLLGLTRIPAAARFFSIDNVNLALALERFDPANHQPQPPGYPFFVAAARIFNFVLNDAWTTFLILAVLAAGLCLPALVALGREIFDEAAGYGAALLLLLNPVFWQSGLDGPLRLHLALFSLLVALCSWRAWSGDTRFVLLGACALGVGSGFRPDLLVYLFPLWIVSAVAGARSIKIVGTGLGVLALIVLVWLGALVLAIGGPVKVYELAADYLGDSSTYFLWTHEQDQGWIRQTSRLIIWNGLAILGWAWAIPFAFGRNVSALAVFWSRPALFFGIWLAPGLVFQGLFHVAAPGHTLFSIPAFCLLGAHVLRAAANRLMPGTAASLAGLSMLFAVTLNLLLFLNFFPLPAASEAPGLLQSVKNVAAYAAFETSISSVRDADHVSRETLDELERTIPEGRPWLIVTTDGYKTNWFMNWRIVRYYAPAADIRVLAEQRRPMLVYRVRRDEVAGTEIADAHDVEVPAGSRIIWLYEPGGQLEQELAKLPHTVRGRRLSYTEVAAGDAFSALAFRFLPAGPPR
jgi:hypothetical protein